HAVLSVEGAVAGRLRQVCVHGGLHVPILHRHVDQRRPSASHRFGPYRFAAERFMARWLGSPTSRTSASNSGLNGVTTPFAAARPDRAGRMPPCGTTMTSEEFRNEDVQH